MESRTIQIIVLVFWLASMTWLARTKIIPLMGPTATPDQRLFRPESKNELEVACWKIRWNNRGIGWARTEIRRSALGQGHVESVVHFERLPTQKMIREMFGTMSVFVRMLDIGDRDLEMTFTVRSQMNFDPFGVLERFDSSVDLEHVGEIFILRGRVVGETLQLEVVTGESFRSDQSTDTRADVPPPLLFEKSFRIPVDALVTDALSPQSRLVGLRVGQTWQFQTYRAFPPQNPFRLIQATVEREEMFAWEGDVEPVKVVTFTDLGGSGLTMSGGPSSHLWVRDDGTVLKQQMDLGNVSIQFLRQPEETLESLAAPTGAAR